MSAIAYRYKDALYLNITNRCPNDCVFCLRGRRDTIGDADTLWHDDYPPEGPTAAEVITAIESYGDLSRFSELVFCGFGEPFAAYDLMLEVARWLKAQNPAPHIRVNTNGLGDLLVGHATSPELKGLIDELSISLNAPTPEEYVQLCNPVFGLDALPAIIAFAKEAKRSVPAITFTVVDLLSDEQLKACQTIAAEAEIPLRIRKYV